MAAGVLALCWVFLLANASGTGEAGIVTNKSLLPPIILSLAALLADLGQYWSGYVFTKRHLVRMEEQGLGERPYDYKDFCYTLRTLLFYAKLFLMLVAVTWLLLLVTSRIL